MRLDTRRQWFHRGLPKSKSRLTQKMLGPGKKKPLTSCWKDRLNQLITNPFFGTFLHPVPIFASGVSSHVTSSKDLTFPGGWPTGPKSQCYPRTLRTLDADAKEETFQGVAMISTFLESNQSISTFRSSFFEGEVVVQFKCVKYIKFHVRTSAKVNV